MGIQTGRTIQEGPLAGEPELGGTDSVYIGPWLDSGPRLRDIARAAVMRGEDPLRAVHKFAEGVPGHGVGHLPGEVPPEGTPSRVPGSQGGSTVPMVSASRQIRRQEDQWTDMIGRGVVLPPPYDLGKLIAIVEESDALPVLIRAMATNLTGYGFEAVPLFPTKADDGAPLDPPAEALAEKEALDLFLGSACLDDGLEGTHQKVDQDVETIGNGYLEVLRDLEGTVREMKHVRGYTVRLGQLSQPIAVEQPFRHPTTGQLVTLRRWRRFRTYLQLDANQVVHFKQFGDPRHINWKTGEYSLEPWGTDENGNSLDGTEILHRALYSCHSEYGVPRWVGATPHALAGRSAAELIVSWFSGAPIGAKLAMVAGGSWTTKSMERAVGKIDSMARGRENAWSLVFLEAEAIANKDIMDESTPSPPRMGLEDLAYELPETLYSGPDSLLAVGFRAIARMFQLPPIYWGGSDDFSRAAANTARAAAEEQVFVPERRTRWLQWWNSELLPSMGINYWGIKLRGANTSDDAEDAKGIGGFIEGGGATPNMLITWWNEMRGTDTPLIAEPWGDRPLKLTELLVQNGLDPNMPLADVLGDEGEGGATDGTQEGAGVPGDVPAQDTALNGAQVTAALAIVQEAVAGGLTPRMAKGMLVAFFDRITPELADEILADAESIEIEAPSVPGSFPGQDAGGNGGGTMPPQAPQQASKRAKGLMERLIRLLETEIA